MLGCVAGEDKAGQTASMTRVIPYTMAVCL